MIFNKEDLKIDTYNPLEGKVDPEHYIGNYGVRITHIPTEITVECDEFKRQISNKYKCIKQLEYKIYEIKEEIIKVEQNNIESLKDKIDTLREKLDIDIEDEEIMSNDSLDLAQGIISLQHSLIYALERKYEVE